MSHLTTNCSRNFLTIKFNPQAHFGTRGLSLLLPRSTRSYNGLPLSVKGPNYNRVLMGGGHSRIFMVIDPISYKTQESSLQIKVQKNETEKEEVAVRAIDDSSSACAASQEQELDDSSSACAIDDSSSACAASQEQEQESMERVMRKKAQRHAYLFAALASSVGITSLAAASVYYRFVWQLEGGEVPWTEMLGTFSLALGAAVGMEFWARWAHRALWHASLWNMHESHHRPREGPFELNDVFAIINAVPAIVLLAFGFLHKGLVPGLCFGAGLGITVFGMAYMFVHDGLVHRRFPVGPIADVPYFQRVAAAHQLHHADKFNGVPYGLFLGPMEVEEVGGRTELEKLLQKRKREKNNPING